MKTCAVIYKHTYNIGRYIEHARRTRAWTADSTAAAKMPQTGQAYPVAPPFRRPMRRADEIDIFQFLRSSTGPNSPLSHPAETRSSRADALCDVLMDSGIVTNWHLQFFAAAVYSPIP
jgi:hypothetical protein